MHLDVNIYAIQVIRGITGWPSRSHSALDRCGADAHGAGWLAVRGPVVGEEVPLDLAGVVVREARRRTIVFDSIDHAAAGQERDRAHRGTVFGLQRRVAVLELVASIA